MKNIIEIESLQAQLMRYEKVIDALRKKLMLADSDENGFRKFRELFKNDYDVIWVRSTPEAYTRFQIERPDAFLVGLNSEELNALKDP